MSDESVTGSCFCGDVRFSVTLPTKNCLHCHCTMCQRIHGAAYVTWVVVPRERFSVDAGSQDLVRFASSPHGTRSFCGRCGSTVLCENTAHPDDVDVTLANLHAPVDREPQLHVYFDDRAGWIEIRDGLPRLGGESGVEPLREEPE